jgi:DNA-binding response OmpR family regulator
MLLNTVMASESRERRATVLVVDHDPVVRRSLVHALEHEGHDTIEAHDGLEGLRLLQEVEPDLMLLDVALPELDGFGVLAAMQDLPLVASTPVVMLVAGDDCATVLRCIEMGADDFLPTPADVLTFRARINAGLNRKRLHDRGRNEAGGSRP